MPIGKLGIINTDYGFTPELTITQFAVLASANAWTFSASNNIATITTTTPHGLTFNPAANVPPNYFVTFSGNITAQTGTGTIIGNYFRILTIPSTTTFTIYTTVTAATAATTASITQVFFFPFIASALSNWTAGPQQPVGTYFPPAFMADGSCNFSLGANCVVSYNPDNKLQLLDAVTTTALGGTPATAPVIRTLAAASTNGQIDFTSPQTFVQASGTTATSNLSIIE